MQTSDQPTVRKILDEKTKELIAIGAAVAEHCQPCLTHHVARARELGIDAESIRAAVGVGQMVERGAMAAMKNFAQKTLGEPVTAAVSPCCAASADAGGKCGG